MTNNNVLYWELKKRKERENKIYKFYFYKKKIKDWFILSLLILAIAYFLNYFKLFSFLNYVIWFISFSSWLLWVFFVYTFIKTIMEWIEIVVIKQEVKNNISWNNLNDIFNK